MKLTHFGILSLFTVLLLCTLSYAVSEQVYVYYLSNETPVVQVGVTTTTCKIIFPTVTLPKATTTTLRPIIIPRITLPSTTSTTRRPVLPIIIPILQKTTSTTATTTTKALPQITLPVTTTTAMRILVITLPAPTTIAAATTTTLPRIITLPGATTTTAKGTITTLPHITLPPITTTTTLPRPRVNNNLVTLDKYSFTNCQCMPTTYKFNVKNTGNFTDIYTFSVEPYPENWYFFDKPFAMLGPNQSVAINLFVVLPCDKVGRFEAAVVSAARYSKQQTRVYFYLETIKCHDYDIKIGEIANTTFAGMDSVSLCLDEGKALAVQLQNKGNYLNVYRLGVKEWEDMPWIALSNTTVTAPAHNVGYAQLNLMPEAEGAYNLSIEVRPSLGTGKKTANLSVNVAKCYDYSLSFEKDSDHVCCGNLAEYSLAITNQGQFTETYYLNVIKPGWAQLSEEAIEVEANSTGNVALLLDVPCNLTSATVLVNSSNSGNTSLIAEMSLGITAAMECYQIFFTDKEQKAYSGYYTLPFEVKNTGSDWASYNILGIEGIADWAYPLTQAIDLSAGEKGIIWLATNATPGIPRGEYPFKLYIETSTGEQYSEQLTIRLGEKNHLWQEFRRFIAWISRDLNRLQKKLFPSKTDSLLYHEWKMDNSYVVDLSTLFYDPDMDSLNFTVSPTENIQAQFEATQLILTPAQGWTGTETIQITADDGKGGAVTTPDITLNVVS